MSDVDHLCTLLQSDKAARRKEGLKLLSSLLDSEDFLSLLDHSTCRIWPRDRIPVASWPGFCAKLTRFIAKEVETAASKRKGADPGLSKVLKKFVQLAEDSTRSGRRFMLLPWSGRILEHVAYVLAHVGVMSQVGTDYSALLRSNLLAVPQYCQSGGGAIFEELLDVFMRAIAWTETGSLGNKFRQDTLSTIGLLLLQLPGDISQVSRAQIVDFLVGTLHQVANSSHAERVAVAALNSTVNFLLRHGLDVINDLGRLHSAAHPLLKGTRFASHNQALKESLLKYVRIQLQLGGIQQVEGALDDLQDILEEDMHAWATSRQATNVFCWTNADRLTARLTSLQLSYLSLAAAVYYHQGKAKSFRGLSSEQLIKRPKWASIYEKMCENAIKFPRVWAPVATVLLMNHGDHLPEEAYDALLSSARDATCQWLKPGELESNTMGCAWLLRWIRELAPRWRFKEVDTVSSHADWECIQGLLVQLCIRCASIRDEALLTLRVCVEQSVLHPSCMPTQLRSLAAAPETAGSIEALPFVISVIKDADDKDVSKALDACISALGNGSDSMLAARAFSEMLGLLREGSHTILSCDDLVPQWCEMDASATQLEADISSLGHTEDHITQQMRTWKTLSASLHATRPVPSCLGNWSGMGDLHERSSRNLREALESLWPLGPKLSGKQPIAVLSACTAGVDLCHGMKVTLPLAHVAGELAQLEVEICSRLAQVGPLVVQACGSGQQIGKLLQCVSLLCDSIQRHDDSCGNRFGEILEECVAALEKAFLAAHSVQSTVHGRMIGSRSTDDLYDDDLDEQTPMGSRKASRGLETSVESSSHNLHCILQVLRAIGRARSVGTSLLRLWQMVTQQEVVVAETIRTGLITALCESASREGGPTLERVAEVLLDEAGLVTSRRFQNWRMMFVLKKVALLLRPALAQAGHFALVGALVDADPLLDAVSTRQNGLDVANVAEDVAAELARAAEAIMTKILETWEVVSSLEVDPSRWDVRLQLGKTVTGLVLLGRYTCTGIEARRCIMDLLLDDCHLARRHSAGLVCEIIQKMGDSLWGLDTLTGSFQILQHSDSDGETDSSQRDSLTSYFETEAEFLMRCGAVSETSECKCVVMLVNQAAQHPSRRKFVMRCLELLATLLGYPSYCAYLHIHKLEFVLNWFADGHTLCQFLSIKDILGLTVDEGGGPDGVLGQYTSETVAALVIGDREIELEELARMAGGSTSDLLECHLHQIFAIVQPSRLSTDPKVCDVAATVLHAGIVAKHLTPMDLDSLVSSSMAKVIVSMLLLAVNIPEDCGIQCPCFYPCSWVVRSILDIDASGMVGSNNNGDRPFSFLWDEVLTGSQVAWLLTCIHNQLNRRCHPRHKQRPLAAFKSLVMLLEDRMCEPATFRYAVHILLQQLHVAVLQPTICELLAGILRRMLKAACGDSQKFMVLGDVVRPISSRVVDCVETPHDCGVDDLELFSYLSMHGLASALGTERYNWRLAKDGLSNRNLDRSQLNKGLVLLVEILVNCKELHWAVKQLEPFPPLPQFDAVCRVHDALCSEVTLNERLHLFASQGASMSVAMRKRAIQHLRKLLDSRQAGIHSTKIGDDLPRCTAVSVSFRLDWRDDDAAALAGQLLAAAGPMDPYTITIEGLSTTPDLLLQQQSVGMAQQSRATRGRSVRQQPLLPQVMEHLVSYLIDVDVDIICCAQRTLSSLLSQPHGEATLASLKQQSAMATCCQYMEVFVNKVVSEDIPATVHALGCAAMDSSGHILDDDALWSCEGKTFEEWVCKLAHALLFNADEKTLRLYQEMAQRKSDFAELLLPFIFQDLALDGVRNSHLLPVLSAQISKHVICDGNGDLKSVRLMLRCLEFLRQCHRDCVTKGSTSSLSCWKTVCWLDVDYLQIAAAHLRCSACFTAMVYVEHWCEDKHGALSPISGRLGHRSNLSPAQSLLLGIYSTINEPDSIYAVARTPHMAAQLCLFEHEGDWQRALLSYDLAHTHSASTLQDLAQGSPDNLQLRLAKCLRQVGCQTLLSNCLQSPACQGGNLWRGEFRALKHELAWKTGCWGNGAKELRSGIQAAQVLNHAPASMLCSLLASLKSGEHESFLTGLQSARGAVVRGLARVRAESLGIVNTALVDLQMLDMVVEAWGLRWPGYSLIQGESSHVQSAASSANTPLSSPSQTSSGLACPSHGSRMQRASRPTDDALDRVVSVWQEKEARAGTEGRFLLMEPLLALHGTLMDVLDCTDRLPAVLTSTAVHARKSGRYTHAQAAILQLKALIGVGGPGPGWKQRISRPDAPWNLEEAKLLWAQGQKDVAVQLGRSIIHEQKAMGAACDPIAIAQSMCLVGKWLAETHSESSANVMALMMEAVEKVTTDGVVADGAGSVACRVLFRLANYADHQYRSIQKQKSSTDWQTSQAVIHQKRRQIRVMEARLAQPGTNERDKKALQFYIGKYKKPVEIDEHEANILNENELKFRKITIKNYGRCLVAGDNYDLPVVFRLCQLWFTLGEDAAVNTDIEEAFQGAPSHKFLPLAYQMASRMSASRSGPLFRSRFQHILTRLLVRLATDHPYHTLYHILALKNGQLGSDGKIQAGAVHGVLSHAADVDKVSAAEEVLRLVAKNPDMREVVAQVTRMVGIYIELAALPVPAGNANPPDMKIPSQLRRKAQDLHLVPVVTAALCVRPDGCYQFNHFRGFGSQIKFVGGVNKPKLVSCVDSDGNKHNQLVKSGNDDLRQDAVMQQFFGLVNNFLHDCSATRKRQLSIATYKVVPFSPAAGLVEWVEDTMPLSDYLVGKDRQSGAHARYRRPDDWTFYQCFQKLRAAKRGDLWREFDIVCSRFTPVLHHFFLEMFRDPANWFERRLAFTRSVAVNSMAGYIIGLGDRHSANILLKRRTAEVVHIDLGIAFEQGRFLNTPELVPFRLTRDLVDGMGINGVEGVMRRCCEEALRVLRANREALVTIVEVFIHDPLYKWALSPIKARQRQKEDSDVEGGPPGQGDFGEEAGSSLGNADAERALLRVKQKLEGTEGRDALAPAGQVLQLIQDAQDPSKLSRMYIGWAPWL